jgi:glutamine amidotransferase PdxT
VPDSEKIQRLRPDESVEERKAELMRKYGTCAGVVFIERQMIGNPA